MASFASLDKRMGKDVNQIHDWLWNPGWKGDAERLLADLAREARELDAYLGVHGKLRRHVEALIKAAQGDRERYGGTLYELLYNLYNLTAATERWRRKDYKAAGEHVAQVVESDSIGTCASLDSFPLVEEWESGKIDFETYASRLADLLQGKGIATAGQYKRVMLAARTFGKEWDGSAPKAQQALAARAAIEGAAWCTVATRTIREAATGRPLTVPLKDYAGIIQGIVGRL